MKTFEVKIIVSMEDEKSIQDLFPMHNLEIKELKSLRSLSQNSAMHKWFEMLEEECTARGITMDMLITRPQDIPITRFILKDLFRFIGKKMFGIKSTTELDKAQFGEVQKVFEKNLSQNAELYIPFPSYSEGGENY
jgi:hypothetical protein